MDALLDAMEQLQGAPIAASLLEPEILPARIANYSSASLDTLFAAGELVWAGVEPIGERDGRIAIYLTDKFPELWPPEQFRSPPEPDDLQQKLLAQLEAGGAQFFAALHQACGGGYPGETLDALWSLVWQGRVTNDSFQALRAYLARQSDSRNAKRVHNQPEFRTRRALSPSAQGRWSLLRRGTAEPNATEWLHKMANQMLNRYGVLVREAAAAENLPGGFSAIYGVLKALEESGRIRRGYFVEGLGATQFALPAAVDLLRSLRIAPPPEKSEVVLLAAQDLAQPYGATLPWPREPRAEADQATETADQSVEAAERSRSLLRSASAKVVLRNGELLAYLRGDGADLQIFLPEQEPDRSHAADELAKFMASRWQRQMAMGRKRRAGLIVTINEQNAVEHDLAPAFVRAGFHPGPAGLQLLRTSSSLPTEEAADSEGGDAEAEELLPQRSDTDA
jgi:ATP-dependent Lhr-like helicase